MPGISSRSLGLGVFFSIFFFIIYQIRLAIVSSASMVATDSRENLIMKVLDKHNKEVDVTEIPDCWHVYAMLKNQDNERAAEMVLECWHQAHAMRDALKRAD